MFEGNGKCSLCKSPVLSHGSHKRTDLDGKTHEFCARCAAKADEVERHLRLRH